MTNEQNEQEQTNNQERRSKANMLLEAVLVGTEYSTKTRFFRTPDNTGYAIIGVPEVKRMGGNIPKHTETLRIRSKAFKQHLHRLMMDAYILSIGSSQLQEVIDHLEADACNPIEEPEPVYLRVAPYKDEHGERVYINLCNQANEAVEIDADGWRIVIDPPVHFIRENGMLPLPRPEEGGSLDSLRTFLHLQADETTSAWHRILIWLVGALNPRGPYRHMHPTGGPGTFKSSLSRWCHNLIDPHSTPLRKQPKDDEALKVAANNCHMLVYDNLSHLPAWLSEGFCRLSTGGGDTTRNHYDMTEETSFDAMRPVIFTSIEQIALAGDLIDRTLMVELPYVPKEDYKTEKALRAEFERLWPCVLGCLYDGVSMALRRQDSVDASDLSRTADAELWARAASPALGLTDENVKNVFLDAEKDAIQVELEDMVIIELLDFMLGQTQQPGKRVYEGYTKELLDALTKNASDDTTHSKSWPKTQRLLSGRLNKHARALRTVGVAVDIRREHNLSYVTVTDTREELSRVEQFREYARKASERMRGVHKSNGHKERDGDEKINPHELADLDTVAEE